jgi:hypothetical protein
MNPMEALKTQLYPLMLQIPNKELQSNVINLYDAIKSDLDEGNYIMSSDTEELYDKFNSTLIKLNSPPEEIEDDVGEEEPDFDFEFEEPETEDADEEDEVS